MIGFALHWACGDFVLIWLFQASTVFWTILNALWVTLHHTVRRACLLFFPQKLRDVVWRGVVWCDVVWCGVVWCGVVWCFVVWCGVMWCGVVWCGVVWCGVMWWVVWCGVVWCGDLCCRSLKCWRRICTVCLGLALIFQSWTIFALSLVSQSLNILFLNFVEIPHMQKLYQVCMHDSALT